jgi:8-oxo-dGTP diphosphatase
MLKVAGTIIKKDGKYLLVQEAKESVRGLWNFPAGKLEEGESAEAAAVRETKEEVGYDVKLIQALPVSLSKRGSELHPFAAEIIGGTLEYPKDELLDAKWFAFEEIRGIESQLRDSWIINSISILENKNS